MSSFPPLRVVSITAESPFQASKWLKIPVLMDEEEMSTLFKELGHFSIFMTSCVTKKGEGLVSHEDFLHYYKDYIDNLKQGKQPSEIYRPYFSTSFTLADDHLYLVPAGEGKQLIRIEKPVIQLQAHSMDYSPVEDKFRSMMFGDSISWGIQFSYPQIFLNPQTKQIDQLLNNPLYPNSALFRTLQKWIRHHTVATPFLIEGKKTMAPIRLGKNCFSWINQHPQLMKRKLSVSI